MATLSGNELMAYNSGFEDGFKSGQASVNAIWILSAITNDGETLEEETTMHKTLAGVIAEIISTGSQTILITPGAIGFSTEITPNTQIPCTITNKTGGTTTITVTLTVLQIEV